MRLRNRRDTGHDRWFDDEVLWGVPRREGYSDTDDPRAHRGVTQHAFELGRDDRAVCGFEPPKRLGLGSTSARPQLALAATSANPQCPKCVALIVRRPKDQAQPMSAGFGTAGGARAVPRPAEQEQVPRAQGTGLRDGELGGTGSVSEVGASSARIPEERSVRRAGTVTIPTGRRTAVVDVPGESGAGVVANVVDGPPDVRVGAISVKEDGTATISLNRAADAPVTVTWFVVSLPEQGGSGELSEPA